MQNGKGNALGNHYWPFFLLLPFYFCLVFPFAFAAFAADWRAEWERTVEAAKKEMQVVVYGNRHLDLLFQEFGKKYGDIRVVTVTGRGSEMGTRVMAERRAGRYLADLYQAGSTTPHEVLYPRKALDPLRPALILPEVVDESKWWQGKHHYVDEEGRYTLIFEGSVQSGGIAYNTKLVKPDEIKSYWDLLNPKWKGRVVAFDPKLRGPVSQNLRFFYYHPDLGPEFIRRLFGEMNITLGRDDRQMIDWVAAGRFPLALFARGAETAMQQGLPVQELGAGNFKEGGFVDPLVGTVSLLNRAPHPNAAKVAINWLLSREGQVAFHKSRSNESESLREDIPKEDIAPARRRLKGVKYILTTRAEWMDMKPIYMLVDDALAKAKK
jgi:iron(III) transport system substrate-binding protein